MSALDRWLEAPVQAHYAAVERLERDIERTCPQCGELQDAPLTDDVCLTCIVTTEVAS